MSRACIYRISGLSPVMLIYIVCRDILFIHFPASTHRVVVATGSPLMMVTAPFLQMGELLPEQTVTHTLEDMIPGPSPLISTSPKLPASASYHPYIRYIHRFSSRAHNSPLIGVIAPRLL